MYLPKILLGTYKVIYCNIACSFSSSLPMILEFYCLPFRMLEAYQRMGNCLECFNIVGSTKPEETKFEVNLSKRNHYYRFENESYIKNLIFDV